MTKVTLVYPYFRPVNDNSIFRFPPLGLAYVAASLKKHGVSVDLVDCTFLTQQEAIDRIKKSKPDVIGIYAMFSMKRKAKEIAKLTRDNCQMLIAGGPLPTSDPLEFLEDFDVAVIGEGEETMVELAKAFEEHGDFSPVRGIAFKTNAEPIITGSRGFIENLDAIPFPAREFFDHDAYKRYYSKNYGYTTTSVITSRGCPFNCGFCSRPIFGNHFRSRSVANIVDEIESIISLKYERIWFADDCFTLDAGRLIAVCEEIIRRKLGIGWECLSRVDTVNEQIAEKMRRAGCIRVFFGLESGNDQVLAVMRKQATTGQARKAVASVKKAGIQVGAFFILGYPGETDRTVLDTVKFASSLPLDYLSFTVPYPIPGTDLYERVKSSVAVSDWDEPKDFRLIRHDLLYRSEFSEAKLKFAIAKGMIQHALRKHLDVRAYGLVGKPFECVTDYAFRHLP